MLADCFSSTRLTFFGDSVYIAPGAGATTSRPMSPPKKVPKIPAVDGGGEAEFVFRIAVLLNQQTIAGTLKVFVLGFVH